MKKTRHLRLSLFTVPEVSIGRTPLTPQNSQFDPRRLKYLEGMLAYMNSLFENLRERYSRPEALLRLETLFAQLPYSELLKIDTRGEPPVTEMPNARDRIVFNEDRLRINFLDGFHRRHCRRPPPAPGTPRVQRATFRGWHRPSPHSAGMPGEQRKSRAQPSHRWRGVLSPYDLPHRRGAHHQAAALGARVQSSATPSCPHGKDPGGTALRAQDSPRTCSGDGLTNTGPQEVRVGHVRTIVRFHSGALRQFTAPHTLRLGRQSSTGIVVGLSSGPGRLS